MVQDKYVARFLAGLDRERTISDSPADMSWKGFIGIHRKEGYKKNQPTYFDYAYDGIKGDIMKWNGERWRPVKNHKGILKAIQVLYFPNVIGE